MARTLAAMLIILLLAPTVLCAQRLDSYVPYEDGEFPLWTYKIRRSEQIFFGSMIITIPIASLAYSLMVNNNLIAAPQSEAQSYLIRGAIAASLSLGISVADYVIGEVRNR